ncbi:lipoprotein [Actinoplanes regularis]|uniref:lipoprotein n=1 Tax=Actinoplanes regularis TaxID=52697 RepID=UPI0024A41C41|nr:lipoprotein [Actinoplanes regularis]GLW33090.1 hypothetical protein Areg01_60280 [Actinoplanes regularis]
MKILCRTTALAALAALALTGCGSEGEKTSTEAVTTAAATPAGPRVGAAGSGCELPVSFSLATDWKPKKVTVTDEELLAALTKKGPFTMACEVDAKPAGNLGFIRIWTGEQAELRPSLEAFIGADAQQAKFTELQVGGKPALEVDYQLKSQLDGSLEQERAFVLDAGKGLVAVTLDSVDSDEYKEMLPAYELARTSLTVN